MTPERNISNSFENYRRDNFLTMSKVGAVLFLLMGYIDSFMETHHSILYLVAMRAIFIMPTFLFYFLIKKDIVKNLDLAIFVIFVCASFGVSYAAYVGGGLTSDYYFGLIIVSFMQFTFVPMPLHKAIILDLIFMLAYFPLNYIPFEHDQVLLIKQVTNFATFSIMKFFAVTRSRELILNGFKNFSLEKELTHKERVQFLFGKLCHLLNNPLFISINMVRRVDKTNLGPEDQDRLDRSMVAQERMTKVLRRMLELHHDQAVDLEKYQEFFKDDDF